MAGRNLVPMTDNESDLGSPTKRWGAVFAVGGSFTGDVEVPTQEVSDSSNLAASTEFVKDVAAYYAPLESPALTGSPTAPTQAADDDSTKLATTAYVKDQVASDTVAGMVELATSAEVLAGVDNERAVTPKGLSEWSKTPVGTIITYPVDSIPSHCLECNGATISRETYSELFTAIGTTYGEGDGSTTFNLPDFRDRFLRGAGGTNAAAFGTAQGDAIRNITGRIMFDPFNGSAVNCKDATGAFEKATPVAIYYASPSGTVQGPPSALFDASNVVPTAAENRPVNYAVKFCIVYE